MFKFIGVIVVCGLFYLAGTVDLHKKIMPTYKTVSKSETVKSIKKDAKRIFDSNSVK